MNGESNGEFVLGSLLKGHSKDVRCVAPGLWPPLSIISTSRDNTARIWAPISAEVGGSGEYEEVDCLREHGGFVLAAVAAPPTPEPTIFTGCQDKIIRCWGGQPMSLHYQMEGHTDTVCCLAYDVARGVLVSGSWDSTARIWSGPDCISVLQDHAAAVWAVAIVPNQTSKLPALLTASADRLIKYWIEGKSTRTFKGHEDCVRGLAVLPNGGEFLSCSNDATVIRWSIATGDKLQTYHGHENYIYSLALLASGEEFASVGEDKSLRIFSVQSGTCVQSLAMPAQSVWSVAGLPNGDVITGSSDGLVRTFTRDPGRAASTDLQEAFAAQVTAFMEVAESKDELGGIKISDLPGPEALFAKGTRNGQTKMIRKGEKVVELHEWSETSQEWTKVGDVLSAKGPSAGKKMFLGKEYDYVFDVDVEDGKPSLKLPYNTSEDPWHAAQKFIHANDLPQTYLEQVANFIVQNAPEGGRNATPDADATYGGDPLTGGSRYVPGGGGVSAGGDLVDPYTGAGRYVPAKGGPGPSPAANDPYTGGGRYIPNGVSAPVTAQNVDPKRPRSQLIPMREYRRFTTTSPKTMSKLLEMNAEVGEAVKLSSEQCLALEAVIQDSAFTLHNDAIKALEKGLTWPKGEYLIPMLDVFHVALLRTSIAAHFLSPTRALALVDQMACCLSQAAADPPLPALAICTGRLLANAYSTEAGRASMRQCGVTLVPLLFESCLLASNRPAAHSAAVAIVANMAKLVHDSPGTEELGAKLIKNLGEQLGKSLDDVRSASWSPDVDLGFVTAVGTLLWGSDLLLAVGRSAGLTPLVQKLKDRIEQEDGKELARSIERMLSA